MIPFDRWVPLPSADLAVLMREAGFFWCLAGGYALEKFCGKAWRLHGDTDMVVFRRDHLRLRAHLSNWSLFAADPPGQLRPWQAGESFPEQVHDIWAHRQGSSNWELQVMLQEADDAHWFYRRQPMVHGPIAEFSRDIAGVPCINPIIQLLYKSKSIRPKDQEDFNTCLPCLTDAQIQRLYSMLLLVYPDGHPWLTRLSLP